MNTGDCSAERRPNSTIAAAARAACLLWFLCRIGVSQVCFGPTPHWRVPKWCHVPCFDLVYRRRLGMPVGCGLDVGWRGVALILHTCALHACALHTCALFFFFSLSHPPSFFVPFSLSLAYFFLEGIQPHHCQRW
jgi:hypothetical protein